MTLAHGREVLSRPMPLRGVVAELRAVHEEGLYFVARKRNGGATWGDALRALEEERNGAA